MKSILILSPLYTSLFRLDFLIQYFEDNVYLSYDLQCTLSVVLPSDSYKPIDWNSQIQGGCSNLDVQLPSIR